MVQGLKFAFFAALVGALVLVVVVTISKSSSSGSENFHWNALPSALGGPSFSKSVLA
jgi:hypothetical protein